MKHTDFSHVIFLENTQTIFNGIERLYELFLHKKGERNTFQEIVDWQWSACYPNDRLNNNIDLRYQNPLHLFFEFLRSDPYLQKSTGKDELCRKDAAQMLALYHAVGSLAKDTPKEFLPERFEVLCNRMRDIMHCDVCYLLYSQRDQTELLSNSSFPVTMVSPNLDHPKPSERVSEQLGRSTFDNLRLYIQRARKKGSGSKGVSTQDWPLADTVFVPEPSDLYADSEASESQCNLVAIVLDFPRSSAANQPHEWIYMVFQFPKCVPDTESLLRSVRNLLFIRKKILDHCIEHMYLLLIAQRTYQYILRLNTSDNPDNSQLRILHLTDLHLQPSNFKDAMTFAKNIYSIEKQDTFGHIKPILKSPSQTGSEKTPLVDLLLITGDVVQANYSAGLLELNYHLAEKFIRALAANLWKSEDGFVRADWQKRIIIIPGNHDYASMNELQAASMPGAKRAIGSGYPARNEGGPMVKFAYYINFMSRLFRSDVNTLIQNQLNEMRCYRQLGLSILALNTISEVGPLRTNKVLMSPQIIKELIHTTDLKKQFPLLLCHHTPNYSVNYLMDRYWVSCDVPFLEQESWITEFLDCLSEILALSRSTDPATLKAGMAPIYNRLCKIRDAIVTRTKFTLLHPEQHDLLWDIVRTLEVIDRPPYFSEQIASLCRSVIADDEMAKRDMNLLRENYKELLCDMPYHLVLGGHTHELKLGGKATITAADYSSITPMEVPFAEGGKFLSRENGSNIVNFGLLDFWRQSSLHKWEVVAQYFPFTYSSNTPPQFRYSPGKKDEVTWIFYTM